MPYSHYGNIGDIWKHLPLCEFLKTEKPSQYIETNSASPIYSITQDPKIEYGVYTYIERVDRFKILKNAVYTKLIRKVNHNKESLQRYLGSPGLVMTYLKELPESYIFFDIEKEPLNKILKFATKKNLQGKVEIYQQDSIIGSLKLLPQLNDRAFIHFDPYYAFEKGDDDISYFDVFLEASMRGLKCMLWYCFFTQNEREEIYSKIRSSLKEKALKGNGIDIEGTEISLEIIKKDTIPINPGVLGCGILISNLSKKSHRIMELYSKELVKLYVGSTVFGEYPGDLVRNRLSL